MPNWFIGFLAVAVAFICYETKAISDHLDGIERSLDKITSHFLGEP